MSFSLNNKYSHIGQSFRGIEEEMKLKNNIINNKITNMDKFMNINRFVTLKHPRIISLTKKLNFPKKNISQKNLINLNDFFNKNQVTYTKLYKKLKNNNYLKRNCSTPNIIKNFQYNINKENNTKNKICLLDTDIHARNFKISPEKVIDYLKLNEEKKLFISALDIKDKKIKKNNKIKKIFTANRKILEKKNEGNVFLREKNLFMKIIYFMKNKAEKESNKLYCTDKAYNSKLLLETMKIYKRSINFLEHKNKRDNKIGQPSYNRFLNIN